MMNNSQLLVNPIDIHKALKTKQVEIAKDVLSIKDSPTQLVDVSWLPKAAEVYNLSPDLDDYIINTVLTFPINVPNRNNLGFSLSNLCQFSHEYGRCWYKTWIGQPAFHNHANKDISKANGIILDVALHKDPRGFYKHLSLVAHDRSKYVDLIKCVENKQLNSYSMGAHITGGYVCSITGRDIKNSPYQLGKGDEKGWYPTIVHVDGEDKMAFRVGLNPKGFEISLVDVPAWSIATSENIDEVYI